MEVTQNIKLIDGVFKPNEAKEIIISLLNSKINFHNLEDFSNQIRFNIKHENSKQRIIELQNAKEELSSLIQWAESHEYELQIQGTIEINLVKHV
ncbi:hypothetical protein [Flavobacterium aciduliphilum]|uniref:Uncharacterized protein n=1 Tax=Flavobacterium aciduliphilum TaxID=1101402 RepID=A0A328YBY3_9FLAO|nr:hypothetical protein [Flavobacterium aciduliphilum]RAR70035.1 hypothetical protein CLV55_11324 [Flavobacterium aciduliphilum]